MSELDLRGPYVHMRLLLREFALRQICLQMSHWKNVSTSTWSEGRNGSANRTESAPTNAVTCSETQLIAADSQARLNTEPIESKGTERDVRAVQLVSNEFARGFKPKERRSCSNTESDFKATLPPGRGPPCKIDHPILQDIQALMNPRILEDGLSSPLQGIAVTAMDRFSICSNGNVVNRSAPGGAAPGGTGIAKIECRLGRREELRCNPRKSRRESGQATEFP